MQKDDLIQLAKNNGIDVAARWSKSDIVDALKKANVNIAETDRQVPVLLLRDYWDDNGARHEKGSVVEVDVVAAKALIRQAKAERADPFPGEGD